MKTIYAKPVEVGITEMLHSLDIATEGFRHMEEIGQHRLHNFLVGDTILLVGWATLFEIGNRPGAEHGPERAIVLVIFAVLSALLSFLWTILGRRERKFLDLQMGIVCDLETMLWDRSKLNALKITDPIRNLQNGEEVSIPCSGKKVELSRTQRIMKSRNLAVWAPFAFGIASLLLIVVSIRCGHMIEITALMQ
jgi:hypothetical protein